MADFFDKMKDGFNKGVATVSVGSKTMIEKTKISSTIKTFEDEKKQLTEILGTKVYNYICANPEGDIPKAEVQAIANEIGKRTELIAEQQQKLKKLDAEMDNIRGNANNLTITCACGHENNVGAKFCAKCGNQIV